MMKAAVYLDGGYINAVLKNESLPKVNYESFSDDMVKPGEERLRSYYYTCMPFQSTPATQDEKTRYTNASQFIYNIKRYNRFEVRLGRLKKIGNEFEQKRVDVLLSVDLVRMSWGKLIDRAVLVTADSDFVPAVQASKDAGVITRLWYYPKLPVNNELLEAFDERYEITSSMIQKNKIP